MRLVRTIAFICTTLQLWISAVLMNPGGGPNKHGCPIPSTGLTISVLHDPPFTEFQSGKLKGILGEFYQETAKKCFINSPDEECRLRQEVLKTKLYNSTSSFISAIEKNTTDIAFPISEPVKMLLSGERYTGPMMMFEVFIKSKEYSLIMDVKNFNYEANEIIFEALLVNIWPIVVFTLLIAGISGILVWVLETYFNEEEFPHSFTKGTYEGFWWAFVSMTTVGYGDKTPKFVFGRVFGVLWILLGLVVIAMFTATATSALSISSSDLARLEGNEVGVLNLTSAKLEAKMRGAEVKVFSSYDSMFEALEHDEIDGILMDKYKAGYYLNKINESRYKVFNSFEEETPYFLAIRDQLKDLLEDGSCMKDSIHRQDVGKFLLDNLKPVILYSHSDSTSVFSGKSPATHLTLFIILGVFLGLLFLGIIGEVLYFKVWKSTKKVNNGDDGIELKEVNVLPIPQKVNLKAVEDKLGQLIQEVSKLQEQLTTVSSHANGTFRSGQNTTRT